MKKILVVCLGNICRSPTAEAVLRAKAELLDIAVEVDSAGTIDYHQGKGADSRCIAAGKKRGYRLDGITARLINQNDFDYFDFILAADDNNVSDLMAICPQDLQYKISLFLDAANSIDYMNANQIPDPYYGGDNGFEVVLDLLESASIKLLHSMTKTCRDD
ncbi:MAG: low molecular weight phosphotyrosine protein phosphatase [Psychromonas sp.]|nr:low molecular weight phosphotyrosine protein phosphatase [Psychromonas sp.]